MPEVTGHVRVVKRELPDGMPTRWGTDQYQIRLHINERTACVSSMVLGTPLLQSLHKQLGAILARKALNEAQP